MLEFGPVAAPPADLLRLVVLPAFGWAAWRDHRTRRITNRLWPPLVAIGLIALAIEGWGAYGDGGLVWERFVLTTALSIGLLVPVAYVFWRLGGFGGADAKAIMTLAVVVPTVPTYVVGDGVYPIIAADSGVFSLSVLTNAVLIGLVYPAWLAGHNALRGHVGPLMFLGRSIPVAEAERRPGRLMQAPDGFDRTGLDLDALRMYLQWRDASLADVRADPQRYRSAAPRAPSDPGDGAIADGGHVDDPWAAEAFLEAVPGDAYGTTAVTLREGLEVLTTEDHVWYSPGLPFAALLAAGLAVGFVYGDLLTVGFRAVGLV